MSLALLFVLLAGCGQRAAVKAEATPTLVPTVTAAPTPVVKAKAKPKSAAPAVKAPVKK